MHDDEVRQWLSDDEREAVQCIDGGYGSGDDITLLTRALAATRKTLAGLAHETAAICRGNCTGEDEDRALVKALDVIATIPRPK